MSDLCGRFQRDSYLRSIGDQILSVNLGGFRKRAGKLTNQLQLFVASSYRAGLGDQVSEWLERRRCETKVELLVLCATFRGHINPVRDEMFIDTWLLTFHSSVGAQCVSRSYFAPTELGMVCDRCGYKHSAPTELNAFGCG